MNHPHRIIQEGPHWQWVRPTESEPSAWAEKSFSTAEKKPHHCHGSCDKKTFQLREDNEARDKATAVKRDEPAFDKFTRSLLHMGGWEALLLWTTQRHDFFKH